MKFIGRAALGLTVLVVFVAGGVFAIGGEQVVHLVLGPKLPAVGVRPAVSGDLAYLSDAVLANDRRATAAQYRRFKGALAGARASTADEVTLAASRAMAVFDNAHSTVDRPMMRRLPVRLHWTADGLIVVRARSQQAGLLGRKVVSIGGQPPEVLIGRIRSLVGGGTPGWRRYRSEYFLSAPAALAALGANVASDNRVELVTVSDAGEVRRDLLLPDPDIAPGDAFRQWRDALPGDARSAAQGWATLLTGGVSAPLYQQQPDRLFLVRDVPGQDAVYIRMNGSINDKGETAAAFTTHALALVRTARRHNLVVDFRYNWGGGFDLALPLVKGVAAAAPADGRIYLLIGPNTFSAGLIAASQLKRYAGDRLVVAGDDAGDSLRFRAEGFDIELPASKVGVYVPTAWDDVATTCGLFDECWPSGKFMLKGVGSLRPDIRAANTWASYRSGKDLVMEAVFADIAAHRARQ